LFLYRDEFNRLPLFQIPHDVTQSFNGLYRSLAQTPTPINQRRHNQPRDELDSSNLIFLENSMPYTPNFAWRARAFKNLDVMLVNFSGQPQVIQKFTITTYL